jgi:hypothetical protein
MHPPLSKADLVTILDEADAAAARLRRRLRLSRADQDDLRQDLLLDLIRRLPAFDARRGSIGAFAGIVLRNQSARIAARVARDRRAGRPAAVAGCAAGDGSSLAIRLSEPTACPPGMATAGWSKPRSTPGSIWRACLAPCTRGTARSARPPRDAGSASSRSASSARARRSTAASATCAAPSPPMARGPRETVCDRRE